MPPEIMQTALLGEWVIVTRKTQKAGFAIAHTKYPIPEIILEQIAYDVLIKQMEGCEKGYTFEITNKKKNEVYKVTVERVKEKWCGCGDELQTDEDIGTGKCGICRSVE